MIMDLRQQTAAFPCAIVVVDAGPRRQIFGKIAPLAASFVDVKNPVEDLQVRVFSGSAKARGFGETVGNEVPFGLGEIRCISHPNANTCKLIHVQLQNARFITIPSKILLFKQALTQSSGKSDKLPAFHSHRSSVSRKWVRSLPWPLSSRLPTRRPSQAGRLTSATIARAESSTGRLACRLARQTMFAQPYTGRHWRRAPSSSLGRRCRLGPRFPGSLSVALAPTVRRRRGAAAPNSRCERGVAVTRLTKRHSRTQVF